MAVNTFSGWIKRKYLDWQSEQGDIKNVLEFAAYLGVSQSNISRWMNAKSIPDGDNVQRLADKLGYEVYELLGVEPAVDDKRLRAIMATWDALPDKTKDDLAKTVERAKERKGDGQKARTRP